MDQSESLIPVIRYVYLPSTEAIAEVRVVLDDSDALFGCSRATVISVQDPATGNLLTEHEYLNKQRGFPRSALFETVKSCLESRLQILDHGRACTLKRIRALDLEIDKLEDRIDLTKKALERVCPIENQDSTT